MSQKITCAVCDNPKPLKKELITHVYKESGLDNVTLVGVEYHKCGVCGEEYFGYGNIRKLNQAIAELLLRKDGLLTGKEVRFLRTQLGLSGAMFARLVGYQHETISRIETGKQAVQTAFDRLVRFAFASHMPDRDYDLHDALLKGDTVKFKRLELKATGRGEWKAKAA